MVHVVVIIVLVGIKPQFHFWKVRFW